MPRDPKRHRRVVKQPRLSRSHRANVVDTSYGKIKGNRVPPCSPPYDTVIRQENRYANLRANPSNLARPSRHPLQRLDGCVPSTEVDTLAPFIPLRSLPSSSTKLPSLSRFAIVSLYYCVCGARFNGESAFFLSRRAPVRSQGCDREWRGAGDG